MSLTNYVPSNKQGVLPKQTKLAELLNNTYLGIVTYTQIYNKETIIPYFMKSLLYGTRIGYIICENKEAINNIIVNNYSELVDKVSLLEYTELSAINSIQNSVIIVDDIILYESYLSLMYNNDLKKSDLKDFYININDNNNYFLIFSNFFANIEVFKKIIIEKDNDIMSSPFFISFGDFGTNDKKEEIDLKLPIIEPHPVKITENQIKKIGDCLTNKNQEGCEDVIKYFTVSYPLRVDNIIEATEKGETNERKINIDELIRIFGTKELLQYSPKVKKLLDTVVLSNGINTKSRHVILASEENYYGVDLISKIFENTEGCSAIWVDRMLQEGVKLRNIQEFNIKDGDNYINNVFITGKDITSYYEDEDRTKEISLKDITDFHILTPEFDTVNNIINNIFKSNNYDISLIPKLKIHIYYNIYKGGPTLENYIYNEFYNNFMTNYTFYIERMKNGFQCKLNSENNIIQVV